MWRRSAFVVAAGIALTGGGHGLVHADEAAPAPIVQPDITGVRLVTAHTTFGGLVTDYDTSTVATERVGIDWAITPSWSVALALPFAFATYDCCYDPEIHLKEWVLGNPALNGRFQTTLRSSGESRLDAALSFGAIVPTADDDSDPELLRVRRNVRLLHFVHYPYDYSDRWPVFPLRGDLRWSARGTAVQFGATVHTMLEDGSPEIDVILANLGVSHAFSSGFDLITDISLVAIPPVREDSAKFCPSVDLALGRQYGQLDVRLAFYAPAPKCHDDVDHGAVLGVQLSHPFD